MSIIDQKKEVFGSIGALNALNDNYPKLPNFNSFPSINNGNNSTNFLIDLVTSLAGFNVLKDHIVNTITYGLPKIEELIKDSMKLELKEIVACNINPGMPEWLRSDGDGIIIKVKNVDFFDIMKVDPSSIPGSLLYSDVPSGVNSKDFNTYLYNTIQSPDIEELWGNSTSSNGILETTFLETSNPTNNNVLKFTCSPDYDNKKLVEFNNAFIDSVTLFGEPNSLNSKDIINRLIEELFGSLSASASVDKSKKQLKKEAEMREVLECIINSENDVIDDSFFEFDNPTLGRMEEEVNNRKVGIRRLETTDNLVSQITSDDLNDSQTSFNGVSTKEEEFDAVTKTLDNLANLQGSVALNLPDVPTIKGDFFTNLIKALPLTIMNQILSPKFITLFAVNHQIIHGQGTSYDGPIDFMKKNKKLIKGLAKIVLDALLSLLLTLALQYLSFKLRQKLTDDEIEKNKQYVAITLSYVGVPQSVISKIRGI